MEEKKQLIKNSKEVSVSLSPWTDKDGNEASFSLFRLHVQESIYGVIPRGEAELVYPRTDKALEMIKNQETGTIEIIDNKESGLSYKFNIFITKRRTFNEILSIEFICIPGDGTDKNTLEKGKNFYTRLLSETYTDIWSAITASYPGPIRKKVETNVPEVKIYRSNETSYDFVKRLGFSWKNKGVFAFGWDGLLLKEIVGINSFNEQEEYKIRKIFGDREEWTQISSKNSKYDVALNIGLFDPWQDPYKDTDKTDLWRSVTPDNKYKELEPKFVNTSITGERKYTIYSPEYYTMEENRVSCEAFNKAKGYGSIVILGQDMPKDWRLGDAVLYSRKKDDENWDIRDRRCLVASNELFYSQEGSTKTGPHNLPFEWQTVLWGIDTLLKDSQSEPWSKELEENTENKESK